MSTNPHGRQWRQFATETSNHVLTVLHDDGQYRHLRMAKPGTSIWSWEIVTWPGALALRGDIGRDGIFSRDTDMIDFFRSGLRSGLRSGMYDDGAPVISMDYWAEKFSGQSRAYSAERFLHCVAIELDDCGITGSKKEEWLKSAQGCSEDEYTAREWLESERRLVGEDTWEWELYDFTHHFILGCYAIAKTVTTYLEESNA